MNEGLVVKSQTLNGNLRFLLADLHFGVWPGLFFNFLECGLGFLVFIGFSFQ